MADWQRTYDPRDLNYLSDKAKQIRDTAALLGVSPLGLIGGVAREMAYARNVDPRSWLAASAPIKEFMTSNEPEPSTPDWSMGGGVTWKPITHQTLAEGFARSNLPGGSIEPRAAGLGSRRDLRADIAERLRRARGGHQTAPNSGKPEFGREDERRRQPITQRSPRSSPPRSSPSLPKLNMSNRSPMAGMLRGT
jgi:hypothetical protein